MDDKDIQGLQFKGGLMTSGCRFRVQSMRLAAYSIGFRCLGRLCTLGLMSFVFTWYGVGCEVVGSRSR